MIRKIFSKANLCGPDSRKHLKLIILFLLSVMVLVSYWGVVGNGFINYDDPAYVVENRHVKEGLTWEGLAWAFTASYVSNWHPLTWISLMLDHDLFGMNAGGYHWTSVILHWFAGLVLFLALGRMTGRLWCSSLVAGFFLVHPLHVESVAWVAERKDVLSGLFWMLGMWGYARYAERRSRDRYAWVLLFFLLGLLSKPMVVTFPFALLLLDYWPLGRMAGGIRETIRPLVYEKIPLFVLSTAASLVTFWVQKEGEAVASLQNLPLTDRLINAVVSYAAYITKMVMPFNLAVFYPHPGSWPARDAFEASILILLISLLVVTGFRRRPYLLVGWLWYLGTLVPVIGIVQVGAQAMADRYTYLPLIGIFMMLVWGFMELAAVFIKRPVLWGSVAGGAMVVLILLTQIQVGYWQDSVTLFNNALRVTERNYQAYNHLGRALAEAGKYEEAIDHYREAIRISPNYMPAYNNLGFARMEQGRLEEAMGYFDKALEMKPGDGQVRFNRGEVYAKKGMWVEAIEEYRLALKKNPYNSSMHNNLGLALTRLGQFNEAMDEYRRAIQLDPGHAGAWNNMAMLLAGRGEMDEAIGHFREALRLRPDYVNAHFQLSQLLRRKGMLDEAAFHLREAMRINPEIVTMKENGNPVPGIRSAEGQGR